MGRRGQVAVGAVGEFDGEGIFEGAAGFDLESGFREDLKRDGRDAEIADPEGLDHGLDRVRLRIAGGQRALGVGLFQTMRRRGILGLGEHAFGPGDHLRRGASHGEFQFLGRRFQRHPVLILQGLAHAQHFLREVIGHELDLLIGLALHGGGFSAVVVAGHVATRAIGQDRHERRLLGLDVKQLAHATAELTEVIRRHILGHHAADIVQPVVGHQRNLPSVAGLHREAIHLRIGGAGGLEQLRLQGTAGVHHSAILAAKGIGIGQTFLQQPAAVEHILRQAARAPRDARGLQMRRRLLHPIDNARDDEGAVVH